MNSQRVTIVLPRNVLQRVDDLAFREHRSRSNAVTLLLAEALGLRDAVQTGRRVGQSERVSA